MRGRNSRKKQFKSIKKNHWGISLAIYAFILGFIAAGYLVVIMFAAELIVNAKVKAASERAMRLALYYERFDEEERKANEELDGAVYYVLDSSGNEKATNGENTSIQGATRLSDDTLSVWYDIYLDEDHGWLYKEKDGHYTPNSRKIGENILKGFFENNNTVEVKIKTQKEGEEEIDLSEIMAAANETEGCYFPLWFSVPIFEGQEIFVCKSGLDFPYQETIWVLGSSVIILFLLALIMILLIINLIRSGARQKRIIDTYMTDPVTKCHNLSWFLLRQEPLLRSGRYKRLNFAVIEVVFVNYRNFCTCHSLEEGEKMLRKVGEVITKQLEKRECCAHVATASFALLLKYENEDQLLKRLKEMTGILETIDPAHKFAFHFGIRLLEAQKKSNGRAARRRNLNLEKEFNNACMARATLSDSDDSRIAFFDHQLVEEKKWIDAVTERQEKAVQKEEFEVYYQPKYDPKTGKLRGAEALIRWNSPDLGFISPGRFIPIFEKNGFITEIDHYMLRHVAADQKRWLDEGLDCVPISVNVSRAHFIESDLAEQIKDMVDTAGTPRNLIEIELTESAFFDDKNAMIQTIQRLKEYGFKVSMDDFGAGYSSLNSLKDMPLDVLKLDADFFRGESEGGRGEIVVSEAIRLAKCLNMHTVAEGVEEKGQVEFLAKQGCDMIQGFYFAKPMPKHQYEDRLKTGIFESDQDDAEKASAEETNTEEESKTSEEGMSAENMAVQAGNEAEGTAAAETAGATEESEVVVAEAREYKGEVAKAPEPVEEADLEETSAEAESTEEEKDE